MHQCSSKRLFMRQRSETMWCRQTAWFRSTPTTSTTIQSPSLIQRPSRPSDGSTLMAHSDVSFDQQKIPSKFQAILCRLLFPLGGVDGTALGNHWLGGKKSYSGKSSAISRMELVLLLATLVQRFVLSVPEGLKLPSGNLSGDAILVQPEQYSLALHRRTGV